MTPVRSNKRVSSQTNSSSFSTGNLSFNAFSLTSLVPVSFDPKASPICRMSIGKVPAPSLGHGPYNLISFADR
ncbi:hypothetical protein PAXRUDRAFT_22460 [Paxillus rubicundulus Ve08.2h10]|uniref:Uncharacterized protein n=1 Tax=Paxillus rubicundulus Ve08.2h10 TaxID=930991 RepID=A0A0D0CXG5_9AGAM|nr:hypothetical protein PAXRUDRAFT_22460 [Paxillus rubicundulus Ve08.2h10]